MSKTEKREFYVTIPIAGSITIQVDAADEDEAKEKAWEAFNEHGDKAGDLEWEALEHIARGNVLYAPCNEVEATEA